MTANQRQSAAALRALHAPGQLLILPNAWNAGSARVIEEGGAAAIATTSSGLSWAHGYPDGSALPPRLLASAIAEIRRVITIPLSADVEAGYADDPKEAAANVVAILDAGAVGINLEDGVEPVERLCAKIEAIRTAAGGGGHDVFINARTDVYLRRLVPADRAVEETVARAARYREAGCDGLFVPGLIEPAAIRAIVAAVAPLPLNLLAWPGLAAAAELRALGVRRLSAGGALASAAHAVTLDLTRRFVADGRSDDILGTRIENAKLNGMFPPA